MVDQGRQGVVGHEPHGELAGHPLGGPRVAGQVGRYVVATARPSGSVLAWVKPAPGPRRSSGWRGRRSRPGAPRVDAVAGEDPGRGLHVVLGVAAAAQRVQLEELATEVLVGRALGRGRVVERDAHGRVRDRRRRASRRSGRARGCGELAVGGAVGEHAVVVDRHVEVVLPELGHHLEHLAAGEDASQQAPAGVILHRLPAALGPRLVALPDRGGVEVDRGPPAVQRVGLVVGDRGRVELPLEPRLGAAGRPHLVVQRRGRAVGEAVGQVTRRDGRQRQAREVGVGVSSAASWAASSEGSSEGSSAESWAESSEGSWGVSSAAGCSAGCSAGCWRRGAGGRVAHRRLVPAVRAAVQVTARVVPVLAAPVPVLADPRVVTPVRRLGRVGPDRRGHRGDRQPCGQAAGQEPTGGRLAERGGHAGDGGHGGTGFDHREAPGRGRTTEDVLIVGRAGPGLDRFCQGISRTDREVTDRSTGMVRPVYAGLPRRR